MIPRIVDAHAPIIKVITDGLVRDGVWDPAPEDDTEEAISGERENELRQVYAHIYTIVNVF
jgi:hypothetical protein